MESKIQSLSNKVVSLKKRLKQKTEECNNLRSNAFLNGNSNIAEVKEGENNAYSAPVRETVIDLISETGVSAENVSKVIEII